MLDTRDSQREKFQPDLVLQATALGRGTSAGQLSLLSSAVLVVDARLTVLALEMATRSVEDEVNKSCGSETRTPPEDV